MTNRWVCLLLLVVAGCRTAPAGTREQEERLVLEAVEARERLFEEAVAAKDPELLVRLYAHDTYLLLPDGEILRKADLLDFYHSYLQANPTLDTRTEFVSLTGSLDVAYEVGTYIEEYDAPDGRLRHTSKYLLVWRKIGGAWRVAAQADVRSTGAREVVYRIDPAARPDSIRGQADSTHAAGVPSDSAGAR